MPSLVKRHFPPSTTRCHFSPERILPPPPFAMKMTFLPEGPLVSLTGRGIAIPEPNDAATRHSPRNKLKQACSTVLHWGNDRFEEVEQFVFGLIDDSLDHSKMPTHQQSEKIHIVYDKATLRFPYLNDIGQPYDNWVIKDLIALRLKHWQATSAGKKAAGKKAAGKKATGKKAAETKGRTTTQLEDVQVD